MTREQLDAIRARVEAATPGPWEAGTAFCCPDCGWVDGPKRTVCPVYEGTKRTHALDANNAEFIASAREDVPALLAEVERLRHLFDQTRHQVADALGVDRGYGWASLASEAAQLRVNLDTPKYVFRGGYIEDESGDRWWSAGLLAKVEAERDTAFRRGAEAMREAAVAVANKRANLPVSDQYTTAWCRSAACIEEEVRALPDPEDKP